MEWLTSIELNGNKTNGGSEKKRVNYTIRFTKDERESGYYSLSASKAIIDVAQEYDAKLLCFGVDAQKGEVYLKLANEKENTDGISLLNSKGNYRKQFGATALYPALLKRTNNSVPIDEKIRLEPDNKEPTLFIYKYKNSETI